MRLLMLPKYHAEGPSSRYRFYNVAPHLEALGWSVDVKPFFHDGYVTALYSQSRRSVARLCGDYLRRTMIEAPQIGRYDAAIIEYELLPYLPFSIESLFLRRPRRWFIDLDDAVYTRYEGKPLLAGKIERLLKAATGVIAGNPYLERLARTFNANVRCIPTTVAAGRYQAKGEEPSSSAKPVIGWIGTPSSARYLNAISDALSAVNRERPILFRAVGIARPAIWPQDFESDFRPWSAEREPEDLAGFDVGVMPLADDEFAKGKSGFKLVQYMAAGIPSVATDCDVNRAILNEGECGLLVKTTDDWVRALRTMTADAESRKQMGQQARRRFDAFYTTERAARDEDRFLRAAAESR